MNHVTLDAEEKLLFNGLLFCTLRLPDAIDIKLTNLKKYLDKGADVNAQDANDINNTPLHIAVKKDEPEIIEFLLGKEANPNIKNLNKQTPLDLAKLSLNKNKYDIIKILEISVNAISNKVSHKVEGRSEINLRQIPLKFEKDHKPFQKALTYENRSGTTGFSGQLYESKLIALLLFRALNDHDIKEFYIGSNIPGLGAFDDIVFKYYLKTKENPTIVFVQAKHKDDPTKYKLTMDSLLNSGNENFSLDKYFMSYMEIIKHKMKLKFDNDMFKNIKYSDCSFLIYTTVMEAFLSKRLVKINGKEALLSTSDHGIFMLHYDEKIVEKLLKNSLMLRARQLANSFASYIVRHKFRNMLLDKLISVYHVFLAQNVVQIFNKTPDFYVARFRESFLDSKDEILMIIKSIIFKINKMDDDLSIHSEENTMEFKLPRYFGNLEVPLSEEEYVELWKLIKNIIEYNKDLKTEKHIIVDDVTVNEIVRKKALNIKSYNRMNYLVGETLILDYETGLLKLNLEESSHRNKQIIEHLKSNTQCNLENIRFELNIEKFPQLSLKNDYYLRNHIIDFLNNLQFHTNQAKEDKVEDILINEISNLYHTERKNTANMCHIKEHAIFLAYHDKVQKWWKNNTTKACLTKSCRFYEEAKDDILRSPMVNIYNYIYVTNINKSNLSFNKSAIKGLGLQAFMERSDGFVLNIITEDKIFTSIKIEQYFRDKTSIFLDLDDIISGEENIDNILSELIEIEVDVIIFVLSDSSCLERKLTGRLNNKKNIVVSHSNLSNFECIKRRDDKNSLSDLDIATQCEVIKQKYILLQGFKVPFVSLVHENMHNLVKGNVLYNIIKNDVIKVGKQYTDKATEHYMSRRVCRCLVLIGKQYLKNIYVINGNCLANAENTKDILIISNDIIGFNKNCEMYCDKNIHWFINQDNKTKWVKSQGSIKNIFHMVERIKCDENDFHDCSLEENSLKNLNDKVIVISAGPGMGKSTLITHLMTQTRPNHESTTCIVKLNLLDLSNDFSKCQECDNLMTLGCFMSILYKSFSSNEKYFLDSENYANLENITYVDCNNRIYLDTRKINNLDELVLFELQVFLNLYNNYNITILFDGFDEVCPDFKKEAIALFQLLLNSRIKQMWITSRLIISDELEYEINTFSFRLRGFSKKEQVSYLQCFWFTSLHLIDRVLLKISQNNFLSQPLHLRMIAEIYLDFFSNYDKLCQYSGDPYKTFNMITLYEKFINKKIDEIRFGEKTDPLIFKNPGMKITKENERILCFNDYKKLAAYSLLHTKTNRHQVNSFRSSAAKNKCREKPKHVRFNLVSVGILTKKDLKHIRKLIHGFKLGGEFNGIIESIVQNDLKFVHLTYAEYFASELICDKLRQVRHNNGSISKYFIDYILVMESAGLRRFIDAKLEKEQILSNFTSKILTDAVLSQRHSNKSALYLAVTEGHVNIAFFLLKNVNEYLQKENLDDFIDLLTKKVNKYCTLCGTYNYYSPMVMTQIIAMIERVDCNKLEKLFFCGDYPENNIFACTIIDCKMAFRSSIYIILKYTNPEVIIKLLLNMYNLSPFDSKRPIIHYLVEIKNNLQYLMDILSKLKQKQYMRIFCARDKMKRTVAHSAAMYGNLEFFDIMAALVTKAQFKIICTIKDKQGLIPLQCGSMYLLIDRFKELCATAGIAIGFKEEGGWFLYDLDNPDCIWQDCH